MLSENEKKIIYSITLARGGSKGIPGKNIKLLNGKPLIAYTLEAAAASGCFSRILVSTDDEKIASAAKRYGAKIPFLRPLELAGDTTPVITVLRHLVVWLLEQEKKLPDYMILLQPTSPLRQPFHIQEAVKLLVTSGADSVIGVQEVPANTHPSWTFRIAGPGHKLALFSGEPIKQIIPLRQQLPRALRTNGAFFGFKTKLLLEDPPSFYGDDVRGYVMDSRYSVDVDTPDDWIALENSMRIQNNN